MKNDCEIIAKNNIEFNWNSKFPINSLTLMRGYIAIDDKSKKEYFDICFNAYWKDNIDISIEKNLNGILDKCKINRYFFEKIKDQKIKDELKKLTNQAFQKDILVLLHLL